jgi:hypothetical protein
MGNMTGAIKPVVLKVKFAVGHVQFFLLDFSEEVQLLGI